MAMSAAKKKTNQNLSSEELKELIDMEFELSDLKEKYGEERPSLPARLMDKYYAWKDAHVVPKRVKRSTYLWLCLLSVFGVNQFYAGHVIKGMMYLALCWTGIPIAFGVIDWMEAVPKKADEEGRILI